jgi:large subunit ribosomal protein L30
MTGKLKIVQIKSSHGRMERHRACLRGLGLRRVGHEVLVEDTPAVRGMARKVNYMVRVEEV